MTYGPQHRISPDLDANLNMLRRLYSGAPDLVIRLLPCSASGCRMALAYLSSLADSDKIATSIIRPLTERGDHRPDSLPVQLPGIETTGDWEKAGMSLLQGNTVLFREGREEAALISTEDWPNRNITDPKLESSIHGARLSFTENARTNIALIRRHLPSPSLKINTHYIGRQCRIPIHILYMEHILNPDILTELEVRLKQVDIDAIMMAGELAELIQDNRYSPFPQMLLSERVDSTSSNIMQGRFAIITDRSPIAIVGPVSIVSFLQSIDDYSTPWMVATFIRLLRYLAWFMAIFLPALYIAVISYNFEVIPLELILSIGESREKVPFPPLIEAMLMELTLEMLREAGIRLPGPIGQTVGVVGGIVIGQAAVQAGIVSNIMVIVVATTAIASFIIPNYNMSATVRLLRFPMMLIASLFGIVGLALAMMTLIAHLISLESMGSPYSTPFAPTQFSDWKDSFMRWPITKMITRPRGVHPADMVRQKSGESKEE